MFILIVGFLFTKKLLGMLQCHRKDLSTSSSFSIGPSICPHGTEWTYPCEIWYWWLLWKSVKKIHIWLKSGKNIRHFTRRLQYSFFIGGNINSLQMHLLWAKWYYS